MPRMAIMPLPSPCKPWQGVQKILYRSSPRSSSSRFIGSGKLLESLGTKSSSLAREPRATVFSTSGRSERPSSKNGEGESGRFFGWLAMSCRRYSQPPPKIREATAQAAARQREVLVKGHLGNVVRLEALHEARGVLQMKLRIASFDANEEAVRGCMREAMHVENGMVRLRQAVQRKHTENRGQRRPKNGQLKRNGNKGGPAIERTAADVHRVGDRHSPVLKTKTAQAPSQAAEQSNERHEVALQAKGLRESFDREGSKGIEAAVARLADFLHGMEEFFRRAELGHHTVNV